MIPVQTLGELFNVLVRKAKRRPVRVRTALLGWRAEAECRFLLSRDLQEGFTWRGVTVTNPFVPTLHPQVAALLTEI